MHQTLENVDIIGGIIMPRALALVATGRNTYRVQTFPMLNFFQPDNHCDRDANKGPVGVLRSSLTIIVTEMPTRVLLHVAKTDVKANTNTHFRPTYGIHTYHYSARLAMRCAKAGIRAHLQPTLGKTNEILVDDVGVTRGLDNSRAIFNMRTENATQATVITS
ncbi:hypothetical protein RRG08_033259 [Elysia crispata]|uniref:Uncharacterized protein n=1 Tax=Elysia crispata TaxID=231223 RepID=A0AAE1CKY4_9GAST|nr:hypothetical protein RRG08_033259 [Elysia crispata]